VLPSPPGFFPALVADFRTKESEHALAVEDEYEGDHDGETDDEDSDAKHLFHHLKASVRTFGNF
jgi:hypothetical protein